MDQLFENVLRVRSELAAASQRWGRTPELIAVTKNVQVERINCLKEAGVLSLGENRVQEIMKKSDYLDPSFSIHCIGQLQTNKVKYIIDKVCMIQSVDRPSLAEEIDRRAQMAGRVMPVLLEVNIAGEAQKGGMPPDAVQDFIQKYKDFGGLTIKGLMCVMPHTSDELLLRSLFAKMRTLFDQLREQAISGTDICELSMGMSGDYVLAAQEGATMVRVGSAIFGQRANARAY